MLKEWQGILYLQILKVLCKRKKINVLPHFCQTLEAIDLQILQILFQEYYADCTFSFSPSLYIAVLRWKELCHAPGNSIFQWKHSRLTDIVKVHEGGESFTNLFSKGQFQLSEYFVGLLLLILEAPSAKPFVII